MWLIGKTSPQISNHSTVERGHDVDDDDDAYKPKYLRQLCFFFHAFLHLIRFIF